VFVRCSDNEPVSEPADDINGEVYLSECGTLGKQTLLINATRQILMTFHAARSAIGQRGFIVRVEGSVQAYMLSLTLHQCWGISERILNGTSAQIGHTVLFTSVHAGNIDDVCRQNLWWHAKSIGLWPEVVICSPVVSEYIVMGVLRIKFVGVQVCVVLVHYHRSSRPGSLFDVASHSQSFSRSTCWNCQAWVINV